MSSVRRTGLEGRLLDLLEYRVILGVVVTTPDGLLVASVAVDVSDAELIAATIAAREERESQDPDYWEASSQFGSLRVVNGEDIRLITLTEPGVAEPDIRPIMSECLIELEQAIQI